MVDKAPRLSISIVIWILSSDTICQLNQFNTNSEATMLFSQYYLVLLGIKWNWVSKVLLCLYILKKVDTWSAVTDP